VGAGVLLAGEGGERGSDGGQRDAAEKYAGLPGLRGAGIRLAYPVSGLS